MGRPFLLEKQARDIMSLATWRVLRGLDKRLLFSVIQLSESSSLFFLLELDIVCISILNLICFRTPTNNSSTLCWIPAEVSMNLDSHDLASFLPSEIDIFNWLKNLKVKILNKNSDRKSYLLHNFRYFMKVLNFFPV